MTAPRNSMLKANSSLLPKWQLKLIEQIVSSMKRNYIHFTKNGKTEEFWKSKMIENFALNFKEFTSEQAMIDMYRKQFKEKPAVYLVSEKDKITQDFVTQNVQSKYAIILNGEGKNRFIYCVIDGELSQDILFNEKSWNEIELTDDYNNRYGLLDPKRYHLDALITSALINASYTKFANLVTSILQTITQDEHLSLGYYPYFIKPLIQSELFKNEKIFSRNTPLNMTIDAGMKMRLAQSDANYGFSHVIHNTDMIIPQNVGFLKIKEIFNVLDPSMEIVQKFVFNLLAQFHDKDSIIIDLRDCLGGSPQGIKYLASFFFEKPTHLCTYIGKTPNGEVLTEILCTDPTFQLDGKSFVDLSKKQLYILIGEETFSAAEEFAYDLQQLRRAQLIGTKTKGGNHFTRGEPLLDELGIGCDERFVILIPNYYSINPISGTNWEDGPLDHGQEPGVRPDIPILQHEDALKTALHLCRLGDTSLIHSGIFSSSQTNLAVIEINNERSVDLKKSSSK